MSVTVCAVVYVDPEPGLVIDTAGGVVSAVAMQTVRLTAAEVAAFPAASYAFAVQLCVPFAAPVIAHP